MSNSVAHLILPARMPAVRANAALALDQLLRACGPAIEIHDKRYFLRASETLEEAQSALSTVSESPAGSEESCKAEPSHDFEDSDSLLWVSVISLDDPTRPVMLQRETFQHPDFVAELLTRMQSTENAHLVEAFEACYANGGHPVTIQDLLLDLCLSEIKQDIAVDLRHLPYSESSDLSDRGDYIKDPFGVDPVAAIASDNLYALQDAVVEGNTDYISDTEAQIVKSNSYDIWQKQEEDLQPVLDVLGKGESDVIESLEEWTRSITSFRGTVDFTLQGSVAVSAIPLIDKQPIYIHFDGVTSGAANAVVDDSYFGMLDLLRVDLRGWVDHLLERSELPKANWNIDVANIIDGFRPQARHDAETGVHWDNQELQESLKSAILAELFPTTEKIISNEDQFDQSEQGQEFNTLFEMIKSKAPMMEEQKDRFYELRGFRNAAVREDAANAWPAQHRAYVFDIALEVFKAQMADLETRWCAENGIDLSALQAITSAKEQYVRFPQLAQHPNYEMAITNLGNNGSTFYDWKNPPHQTPTRPSLVTHKSLCELLDNCNYDGNLVVAFECDLDDLKNMGLGMQEGNTPKEVTVSGAYVHIHNYTNGAGDGVEMESKWSFTTEDLRSKRMRLDNDSLDKYGIQGVFGQFLASGSGIIIEDLVAVADVPHPVFYSQIPPGESTPMEVIVNTPTVTAWAKTSLPILQERIAQAEASGKPVADATRSITNLVKLLSTGNTPLGSEGWIGRKQWDLITAEVAGATGKAPAAPSLGR